MHHCFDLMAFLARRTHCLCVALRVFFLYKSIFTAFGAAMRESSLPGSEIFFQIPIQSPAVCVLYHASSALKVQA